MPLLHEVFKEAAAKHADRVAFDSVDCQISFEALFERTQSLAGALQDLGIQKGERVAILSQNCADYIAWHYAAAMTGAILLVLNTRHTPDEMLWALNNAGAAALIVGRSFEPLLPVLTEGCKSIRTTIGIDLKENQQNGPDAMPDHMTDDLATRRLAVRPPPAISERDPILLIYTSGTTGRPKGAMQTHEGSTMIDALTADALGISPKDVYLAFMPYFHQAGLIRTRATMIKGGINLVSGKLDPEQVARLIEDKHISITMLPPPYDTLLSDIADRDQLAFSSLRMIVGAGGAGPVHARAMQAFCDRFGCDYMGVYGQTEVTGPATLVMGRDYFNNPLTCGKPMQGIELAIWDVDKNPVPAGTVGEIMIRARTCTPGYWNNIKGTRDLYTDDWLHTGDLARLDKDGFLYFVDRKKELVKTGGENVYPREVEMALAKHPAISDLAIIGLKDPTGWGELVTAVVVLKEGTDLTLEEVKEYCRGKISGYKIPRVLKTVTEIPRNITGKVLKLSLRDKFSAKDN